MNICEIVAKLFEDPRDALALEAARKIGYQKVRDHSFFCESCMNSIESIYSCILEDVYDSKFEGIYGFKFEDVSSYTVHIDKLKKGFMVRFSLACEHDPMFLWKDRHLCWDGCKLSKLIENIS